MVSGYTEPDGSIWTNIRLDELDIIKEKAKKWDMFENTDPDATIPIIENIDLRQQIKTLEEELIKVLDSKKELQYDKEAHIECARNCADFAEKAYKQQKMLDDIRKVHKEWSNDNDSDYPYWKKIKFILGDK